jgi:NAD(P)-dependent dehydrogenase (short-subunit alcohol dehydrogenase family)
LIQCCEDLAPQRRDPGYSNSRLGNPLSCGTLTATVSYTVRITACKEKHVSFPMNKVIVITGGSRGIGAATARVAAVRGYAVCVNYLKNQIAADAVVDKIRSNGGQAIAVGADVALETDVANLFEVVDMQLGTVTALVNNAGILETQMRVEEMDAARLNRIFATNITGCFLCAKEAVKRMSSKHGGRGGAIVNVSSAASRLGAAGEYVDYAASKGAVDTFTLGLSREVAAEGIRVNAVRPAFIYTDIHASGGEPGRVDRIKDSIPMRRGGHPEEVANAIMWLLSDEASYTTGTFIDLASGK